MGIDALGAVAVEVATEEEVVLAVAVVAVVKGVVTATLVKRFFLRGWAGNVVTTIARQFPRFCLPPSPPNAPTRSGSVQL